MFCVFRSFLSQVKSFSVSVFWNLNFKSRCLVKRSLCPWNQPNFLRNSGKILLSSDQNKLMKSETWFCRWKTSEDNNTKINVSPNTLSLSKLVYFFKFSSREIYLSIKFQECQFFSIVNLWHSFTDYNIYFFTKEHSLKHRMKQHAFLYLLTNLFS